MSRHTHVEQSNGVSRGPLVDSIRPYEDQIRSALGRMNGTSFWAYGLWRAPEGSDLDRDIPLSESYLQCAGSAEALTIEVRAVDGEGVARQSVVGRSDAATSAHGDRVIRWDDGRRSTTVGTNEVFTAAQAGGVFVAYFLTDEVPERCTLRTLDLDR